ncbi:MAG: SAM-dependent methyltransferase [Candidatus Nitrospinota bacterium M3_3B_026]
MPTLYPLVFIISAAVIGLEILLMRMFSISQWSHFAWMIISLALLGFGMSGTFLALARRLLERDFPAAFFLNAALFGVSTPACHAAAQRIPFNPLEIAWDARQALYMAAIYLVLSIPFFFAANVIGLAFIYKKRSAGAIYRADLAGAGAGAFLITVAMFWFYPETLMKAASTAALTAAAFAAALETERRRRTAMAGMALLAASASLLLPAAWLEPKISEYKQLSQALLAPGAKVIKKRTSPLGLLTVVKSPLIPFRHAPGLSLNSPAWPPEQLGVFTDAGAMTAITRYSGGKQPIEYLDYTLSALPYHLLTRPKVLALGAGGGSGVLLALYHGADAVDAVEPNPDMARLVRDDFSGFAGGIYGRDNIRVHVAEARGYIASTEKRYDLIQLHAGRSAGDAAGAGALNEGFAYTVEAFRGYLRRLTPGGMLAVTGRLKLPPRDTLKILATAVEAMERNGETAPGKRMALVRGWSHILLLVKNGEFSREDIKSIKAFCGRRSFDTAYHPGVRPGEVNTRNILQAPYFYEGALKILGGGRAEFMERYKFDISPATDDRPYFFNFFKWRSAPEFFGLISRGGAPLVEWGYVILSAALVQAAVLSAALVLAPLRALGGGPLAKGGAGVVVYFTCLGLGFMFIEMSFIQKFTLYLSHPIYAAAVILSSFLVFAGLGSGFSARLGERVAGSFRPVDIAAGAVITIAGAYLFLLPPVFGMTAGFPEPQKAALSVALLAPLGFFMGMPFPLGLSLVAKKAPSLVPWAWGINGCASVMSAVLAVLLAIHFGFMAVVAAAACLYAMAAASLRLIQR